ncbi:MAG TPA: hypothetical protein VI033_08430 [Candidatus Nitrosopolaris sp.]
MALDSCYEFELHSWFKDVAKRIRRSRSANAVNALITADKNLNESRNEEVIRDVFIRRGILPNQNRNNKRAGLPFDQLG